MKRARVVALEVGTRVICGSNCGAIVEKVEYLDKTGVVRVLKNQKPAGILKEIAFHDELQCWKVISDGSILYEKPSGAHLAAYRAEALAARALKRVAKNRSHKRLYTRRGTLANVVVTPAKDVDRITINRDDIRARINYLTVEISVLKHLLEGDN